MICLFCPMKGCPDAGIVDGLGCCDLFPASDGLTDEQRAALEEDWREEEEMRMQDEMFIERGICPHCGKPLHSDQ